MLVEFRVANHRSLLDEQALTLSASPKADKDDVRLRRVPGLKTPLLPAAAIYGANASGKSNVLRALDFMRRAVRDSARQWPPEGGVPREPFAWGDTGASVFEATFVVDDTRFEYGFVADDARFAEEWLFAWPSGKKKHVWFEREGDSVKFGDALSGTPRALKEATRPNALLLSTAAQLNHERLLVPYLWFADMRTHNVEGDVPSSQGASGDLSLELWNARNLRRAGRSRGQLSLFPDLSETAVIDVLRDLMRVADVGIDDLKLVTSSGREPEGPRRPHNPPTRQIMLHHVNGGEGGWLPLEEESKGTVTLLRMAPAVLDVLLSGSVLLVDELEASLHPRLADQVLRHFSDPVLNPRGAQILFATHDTALIGHLVGEPRLRRDQIWLTEKRPDGSTSLYPLTDFKPRAAENLERGYLQGRYGAVPNVAALFDTALAGSGR
jgi:predicted ATPase